MQVYSPSPFPSSDTVWRDEFRRVSCVDLLDDVALIVTVQIV